jgi:hypothetical protein
MSSTAQWQRSERKLIEMTRQRLRQQRWLRCHVLLIALCTLGCLALGGALLRSAGIESLAWRYALLLPLTYLVYLGLLRLWAAYLVGREQLGPDGLDLAIDVPMPRRGVNAEPEFHSGGGGDFGGGGASGDFGEIGEGAMKAGGEVLGALDEGAVVALPLLAVVAIAGLLAGLLGAGVFVLFGVEVLLAVAVEVALAALAGGFAWRRQREGWLSRALGHTWRAAFASLVLGVALGAAIDHWLPEARSLPHALSLWRQS